MCMDVYVCVDVCAWMCVCVGTDFGSQAARAGRRCMYGYVCVCVCLDVFVCVCMWAGRRCISMDVCVCV